MENAEWAARGKRKQKHAEREVKMKKKKSQKEQLDVDGNDAALFLHTETAKLFIEMYLLQIRLIRKLVNIQISQHNLIHL